MRISLEKASSLLLQGEVVALPTETVYGLGASLDHLEAIQKIFSLKKRPSDNPLIIHVEALNQVEAFSLFLPDELYLFAEKFWPGPLTVILPIKTDRIPSIARANLPTAAFRIPCHPLVLELLKKTGPLVMPSANLSGSPSATSPEHVEADFGIHFPILDGGNCHHGLESTILFYEAKGWKITRLGSLPAEAFIPILGYTPPFSASQKAICPGSRYRHYAPKAKLHLSLPAPPNGLILGFKERHYSPQNPLLLLGSLAQPEMVAKELYTLLRFLDEKAIPEAWIDMNFPRLGLWNTIAERLQRAAAN